MNRRAFVIGTVAAIGLGASSAAHATDGYVGGFGGYNFVFGDEVVEDAPGYGGVIGIDFGGLPNSGFALELSAQYTEFDGEDCADLSGDDDEFDDGNEVACRLAVNSLDLDVDLQLITFGAAARYNLALEPVRFYFLAGGELHLTDFEVDAGRLSSSEDDEVWGVQLGGGLELALGEHVTIGPDVRYHILFADDFDTFDEIERTDIGDAPDFLSVMGRLNLYF